MNASTEIRDLNLSMTSYDELQVIIFSPLIIVRKLLNLTIINQ
jgi:hypothetical protein